MSLRRLENSRVFMIALLIVALVLLALTASNLGGDLPERAELKGRSTPTEFTALVRKAEAILAPATLKALHPATNEVSPFYTIHFQPAVAPPKTTPDTAPPAKPVPKKVQLTYQGVYETAGGEKKAFVKVGDSLVVGATGAKIVADWSAVEIALRTLTLKNEASQTNILEFNVPKEIEIPNP